jgi:hypothetical protein
VLLDVPVGPGEEGDGDLAERAAGDALHQAAVAEGGGVAAELHLLLDLVDGAADIDGQHQLHIHRLRRAGAPRED